MPWLKAIVAQRFLLWTLTGPMASLATLEAFRVLGSSPSSFVAFPLELALEEGLAHLFRNVLEADEVSSDEETAAFSFSEFTG